MTNPISLLQLRHRALEEGQGASLGQTGRKEIEKVKEWFYNHGRKTKKKEDFQLTNKWTWRRVHAEEHKKELREKTEDKTGVQAGSQEYLGHLKRISAEVQAELTSEEIGRLMEIADQWNSEAPPVANQQKMAEEKIPSLSARTLPWSI
ncbi:hypothetical protein JAAARDRAFT_199776 [Jaapia argillacea MUCL 33604]|uniref:Uncharacterized protein n=1 Tax=Jaapia argillacea MUCL 33604 TaxID=933084 RepID=A0A067PHY1_9AGAM|nr:hypothetical protein JAAARDRAFT_199776 [Jaapia argillacea MUCL 33604]